MRWLLVLALLLGSGCKRKGEMYIEGSLTTTIDGSLYTCDCHKHSMVCHVVDPGEWR